MTAYRPGDVLLVPFPFTDFTTVKQRPCVVISSATFNKTHPDLIVAAITSQLPKRLASDEYQLSTADLEAGGLPKSSIVRIGKIITLDQRLIRKRLGSLPENTTKTILQLAQQILSGD